MNELMKSAFSLSLRYFLALTNLPIYSFHLLYLEIVFLSNRPEKITGKLAIPTYHT